MRAVDDGIQHIRDVIENMRTYVKVLINPDHVAQWRRLGTNLNDSLFDQCWKDLEDSHQIFDARKGKSASREGNPDHPLLLVLSRRKTIPEQIEEIEQAPLADAHQIIFVGAKGNLHGWFSAEPFRNAVSGERTDNYKQDIQKLAEPLVLGAAIRMHGAHLPISEPGWSLLDAARLAGEAKFEGRFLPCTAKPLTRLTVARAGLTRELNLAVFDTRPALMLIAAGNAKEKQSLDLAVTLAPQERDED